MGFHHHRSHCYYYYSHHRNYHYHCDRCYYDSGSQLSILFSSMLGKLRCQLVDHDRRIYETVGHLDSGFAENLDHLTNVTLNTKIVKTEVNPESIQFTRALSGILGFRVEREEKIDGYDACVYHINHVELVTTKRREHLEVYAQQKSQPLPPTDSSHEPHSLQDPQDTQRLSSGDSLAVDQFVDSFGQTVNQDPDVIESYIDKQKASLFEHRHSLTEPPQPDISLEDYFFPDSCDPERPIEFHLGRPIKSKTKRKTYKATLWMSETFPFPLQDLLPLLDLMTPTNEHLGRLKEFVEIKLPPGFPVQICRSNPLISHRCPVMLISTRFTLLAPLFRMFIQYSCEDYPPMNSFFFLFLSVYFFSFTLSIFDFSSYSYCAGHFGPSHISSFPSS
jgi:hypothetical protein